MHCIARLLCDSRATCFVLGVLPVFTMVLITNLSCKIGLNLATLSDLYFLWMTFISSSIPPGWWRCRILVLSVWLYICLPINLIWYMAQRRHREALSMLVTSFITSKIDNCNVALAELPQRDLDRIRSVLNAAARLTADARKFDHVTPLLVNLHWLRVHPV